MASRGIVLRREVGDDYDEQKNSGVSLMGHRVSRMSGFLSALSGLTGDAI